MKRFSSIKEENQENNFKLILVKILEFLTHLGDNFGILRTILYFLYILDFVGNFLAWNFSKIDGIFRTFCRVYEELF